MKIILKVLTALFLSAAALPAQGQNLKLGHLNIPKVLEVMPEYKEAEKKLQEYLFQLQEMAKKMEQEYATKVDAYYKDEPNLLPPVKEVRQKEITDLEARIVKFQSDMEEKLSQQQVALLKPLEEQVLAAIKGIAAEKGYSYIFDTSTGVLLYYPPADDVTDLVKAKMGLK